MLNMALRECFWYSKPDVACIVEVEKWRCGSPPRVQDPQPSRWCWVNTSKSSTHIQCKCIVYFKVHGYLNHILIYMYNRPIHQMHFCSSQEIIAWSSPACRHMPQLIGHRREDAKSRVKVFIDSHDGCNIAAAVTIVGSGPNSHDRVLWEVILLAS